jgi:hypothetical protein
MAASSVVWDEVVSQYLLLIKAIQEDGVEFTLQFEDGSTAETTEKR